MPYDALTLSPGSDALRMHAMSRAWAVATADLAPTTRPEWLQELQSWIAAGYYGRCSVCRDEIDTAVLDRDPTRRICSRCEVPHGIAGRLR